MQPERVEQLEITVIHKVTYEAPTVGTSPKCRFQEFNSMVSNWIKNKVKPSPPD